MRKMLLGAVVSSSLTAYACPENQHRECILPRPWGGCAQYVCVPDIPNPFTAMQRAVEEKAWSLAIDGKAAETFANQQDCTIIVTAGLATWGTTLGGPWVGLATGVAGGAAARMACRRAFPVE